MTASILSRQRFIAGHFLAILLAAFGFRVDAYAADVPFNYVLAAGDSIRVLVFQNPDMTLDTRVSEDGTISYPLVGSIVVGGLAIGNAEKKVAKALQDGGFIKSPQVNIQLVDIRGNMVSVLGQVNHAGAFPLLTTNTRVSQALAQAGGQTVIGDDKVILTGMRNGKPMRREIDMDALYRSAQDTEDPLLMGGDTIYVPRAPLFYVYGEVIKPGEYRIDRNMTMRQAIAAGGGITLRGTERRLRVVRKDGSGAAQKIPVELDDPVLPGDVIYVNESLF